MLRRKSGEDNTKAPDANAKAPHNKEKAPDKNAKAQDAGLGLWDEGLGQARRKPAPLAVGGLGVGGGGVGGVEGSPKPANKAGPPANATSPIRPRPWTLHPKS